MHLYFVLAVYNNSCSYYFLNIINWTSALTLTYVAGIEIEREIAKTPVTDGKPFDGACATDLGDKSPAKTHSRRSISHATVACVKSTKKTTRLDVP